MMKKHNAKESEDVNGCRRATLLKIKERLPVILQDPIVQEFLRDEESKAALDHALETLQDKDINKLDEHFKEFYRLNRALRYLTGLIKRYAIDYDKRVKLRNFRYQLIVDKPMSNGRGESNSTMLDMLENSNKTPEQFLMLKENEQRKLFAMENHKLSDAIELLEPKQHQILYLYYAQGFTNKEIGKAFRQTEQNISYWHKKTLKQLEKVLV
ncbi:sigma-70 family RNA polymerase sigma factor [Mesobacillus boroniphilus]|uniref:RNA polymerase sigma factor n=1 Tax=Mesobacillus boroniphilus JCM 21738 TaxID=1294265 RepID=W4RS22_9BACI|nr:sigma-70 family RNA polymerase sigma factor [Mesobacillus boroniphilus]GAE47111.1 RNA polymerase sigma factor [Mesobacillus boroniphilus JCM 21738]